MATVVFAKGTILQMHSASTGTFSSVDNALSISGPDLDVPMLDKTVLTDTRRRVRPGLPGAPELTITLYHDPVDSVHGLIKTAAETNLLKYWKITVLNPSTGANYAICSFPGYPHGWKETGLELDGLKQVEVPVALDDFPSWASV